MYEYQATIVSEHDGDTLHADVDLGFGIWIRNQDFRLNRINTPELYTDAGGPAAKEALTKLLPLGVTVLVKTLKDKTDKYGRMLGDFYLADGSCVNDLLVTNGFAKYYDGHGVKPV